MKFELPKRVLMLQFKFHTTAPTRSVLFIVLFEALLCNTVIVGQVLMRCIVHIDRVEIRYFDLLIMWHAHFLA